MKKHHVALFCSERLLGESLERLLSSLAEVDILGPWVIDESAIHHLEASLPQVVVIADENIGAQNLYSHQVSLLTTQILEKYAGLPVLQVFLEHNQVRIFNSHTVPARSEDLIKAIRNLYARNEGH